MTTLYQPFLDEALALVSDRLDLEDYPIPQGFESKRAISGKGSRQAEVLTTSYAYQSPKLRQIRAAHVQGGKALQVLNFVIFPRLNYDLPFFGGDLVTLPAGHLIAIDMQPLFHSEAYRARYTEPIRSLFEAFKDELEWGGDFPEEAQAFFSPAFIWTRPREEAVVKTTVFEAFRAYLDAYLSFVERAEPITDEAALERVFQAQMAYLRYRAQKDPARAMFNRIYGSEWTEEYIHGFLFDLERSLGEQQAATSG